MDGPSDDSRKPLQTGWHWPADLPELAGVDHEFLTLPNGLRMHVATAGADQAHPVL